MRIIAMETKTKAEAYLQQLTALLKSLGSPQRSLAAKADKNSSLEFLAIRVPVLKEVATRSFALNGLDAVQRLRVWDYIWQNSPYFEVMAVPLYHYRSQGMQVDPTEFKVIGRWINRVENWSHCDELSYVLSCFTEQNPPRLLPYLARLNRSRNIWQIRASIVSTVHYAGKNSVYLSPDQVFPLLEPHVANKDKYVAKPVRWVLREMHRRYPRETATFANVHAQVLGKVPFGAGKDNATR